MTFAAVAIAASLGGAWAVSANEYGRWIALGVLTLFAERRDSPGAEVPRERAGRDRHPHARVHTREGHRRRELGSPETYVGYQRAQNFASGEAVPDQPHAYARPAELALNPWGLEGTWSVQPDRALLGSAGGRMVYRFHARDLHLVLGPSEPGRSLRFRIRIDGAAPGEDHGTDIGADGLGTVTEHRLYQLVRQRGAVADRTFEIGFLDAGVEAFAFTFGGGNPGAIPAPRGSTPRRRYPRMCLAATPAAPRPPTRFRHQEEPCS